MIYSDPRPAALTLIESGDLSVEYLWHQYRARGGTADALELDAFIHDVPLLLGEQVEILEVTLKQLLPTEPKAATSKKGSQGFIGPISTTLKRVLGLKTTSHRTTSRKKS